ncbi:hypothetical protein V500_01640 [Pseudogymnoascus sp. VKM F-4518 (FW-2643)]|nr:hypothetical protein V500_01640 [Pseudogymnoascus sp. VKM F-4518 (FW-2643)]
MVGTQKWSMEEILWVITMVKQGLKDEEIYEKFCEIFKNARHVRGASSIKYCRTGFMKQEEYCQERYWEDTPGKIGFVLGRHDAGVYNGQVVADVMHHFPTHTWPPHIKPLARCIEFSGYTQENPLVEPVLRLTAEGISPGKIFETANENGISLDDIYYIMARFGMEVKSRPTAWDNSNYGHHYGASSAGASTSQAAPGNGNTGPLIFQLPPTDPYKKSKAHEPWHNSHRSSDTSSRLSHRGHGYEYINREGNQVAYHGVQRDLGTSVLNSGYPQGIPSEASSQAQLHDLQRRPRPELLQPSQQHGMGFHYPHISQDGQLQHPMTQQRFGQRDFQEYTGDYPNPTMQPTLPGQFHQQNRGHDSTFGRQQRVPEQPQNRFLGYQQAPGHLGQWNYGSSSQAGLASYQPQPGHNLNQAFYSHPQQILTQERQQPVRPATGYENIDPALLRMDTNQASHPDIGIMTLSQPPLTPRIAPQDFLHPFAYSGIQNGQDISPLTIENHQFPVLLPPSPEVTHDGLEHRGQSTIPDPFVQRSVLTGQPQLGFGTDLRHSSGRNGFDQDTFDHALTLSSETNATTLRHENSRELIHSVLDVPDQRGDQERSAEGSIAEKTSHTAVEETVVDTPITNQEPLSEVQPMELDNIEEAATLEELLKLFLDLEYQNPLGCNFNYDGSMIGSGGIDHFENTFSKNNPEAHGPQDNWPCDAKSSLEAMEAVSKNLETEMAGPFLTRNSTEHNDVSDGIQCNNSGVFEDGYAPEGTCCAGHQNFECYFEVPDSDGENATVLKP